MEQITEVSGGVCAAAGFSASGVHCGIRKNKTKNDFAMIFSEKPCAAAAVFTKNKVQGAPITVDRAHLADHTAQAIICNSGKANTCAPGGVELAEKTAELAAAALGIAPGDVLVASTGVIGQALTLEPFEKGIPEAAAALSRDGSSAAATAIMTTDTVAKEAAVAFEIGGKTCHIGAIAKGSGMIHPNMATMLCFITSDVAISPQLCQKALSADILDSFNQLSVDGDTSTNDTVLLLCSGAAGNDPITGEGPAYDLFCAALAAVTQKMCRKLAADGEGATKLLTCTVTGAPDRATARTVAKSVISSSLLKSAMFGRDANWGRIICAVGYADAEFDASLVDIALRSAAGTAVVCRHAVHNEFDEELALKILSEDEIEIGIEMNQGGASAKAWGCDLTYDYVKINGDYRT